MAQLIKVLNLKKKSSEKVMYEQQRELHLKKINLEEMHLDKDRLVQDSVIYKKEFMNKVLNTRTPISQIQSFDTQVHSFDDKKNILEVEIQKQKVSIQELKELIGESYRKVEKYKFKIDVIKTKYIKQNDST